MNLAADMGRYSGRATPSLHDDPYRQIEEATGRRSTYPLPILVQTNRATSPSVGSVGDSCDNALAETMNGLYKAEVIHRRGPWRSFEAVEFATLEWVDWFNQTTSPWPRNLNQTASGDPGAVHCAAELHKQWPPPLRPTGSATQAIAYTALMRKKTARL